MLLSRIADNLLPCHVVNQGNLASSEAEFNISTKQRQQAMIASKIKGPSILCGMRPMFILRRLEEISSGKGNKRVCDVEDVQRL